MGHLRFRAVDLNRGRDRRSDCRGQARNRGKDRSGDGASAKRLRRGMPHGRRRNAGERPGIARDCLTNGQGNRLMIACGYAKASSLGLISRPGLPFGKTFDSRFEWTRTSPNDRIRSLQPQPMWRSEGLSSRLAAEIPAGAFGAGSESLNERRTGPIDRIHPT